MTREAMKAALRATVQPALRFQGFTGSFPHFRRLAGSTIDLLTVQFDRHGGGFVIELAQARNEPFLTPWGSNVPPDKLTAHELHPGERARLQPGPDGSAESWFRYDRGTLPPEVAEEVLGLLREAEAWWAGTRPQPHIHRFAAKAV